MLGALFGGAFFLSWTIAGWLHHGTRFAAARTSSRSRAVHHRNRAAYSRGLIEPATDFIQIRLDCCFG